MIDESQISFFGDASKSSNSYCLSVTLPPRAASLRDTRVRVWGDSTTVDGLPAGDGMGHQNKILPNSFTHGYLEGLYPRQVWYKRWLVINGQPLFSI